MPGVHPAHSMQGAYMQGAHPLANTLGMQGAMPYAGYPCYPGGYPMNAFGGAYPSQGWEGYGQGWEGYGLPVNDYYRQRFY